MATKKTHTLHNHNFFFPGLRWGSQQLLPCMKFDPITRIASSTSPTSPLLPYPQSNPSQDHRLRAIPAEICRESVSVKAISASNGKEEESRSMAPCNAPIVQQNQVKHSRRVAAAAAKREQQQFSVSLTKEEIEEDFLAMKGLKLPRRPKKRQKVIIQQQLDGIFPGLGLPAKITPARYRVARSYDSNKR